MFIKVQRKILYKIKITSPSFSLLSSEVKVINIGIWLAITFDACTNAMYVHIYIYTSIYIYVYSIYINIHIHIFIPFPPSDEIIF